MNILDTRTIMLSYLITNALSAMVTFSLWRQNRRLPGLHFWLADFLMQFIGIMLIILRGSVSDFLSMVVSNTLLIGGLLALLIGFEKYTNRISAQWPNYFGLAVFFAIQAYFSLAQPSLQFRNINIAVFTMLFSLQSAWLLLRRADLNLRQDARSTGLVLVGFGVLSLIRILVDLTIHPGNDFFNPGFYDSIILMSYQTLYLSLAFSLFLMVNRRLNLVLQNDLTKLNLAAESLRASEEKFSKAFQTSPFAITITNPRDGRFLEVNDAFCAITGYSREEALNSTTLSLNLWVNLAERAEALEMLKTTPKVWGREIQFRKKNGEIFVSLFSCQNIQWGQEACVFASIEDISERKQNEKALRENEALLRAMAENYPNSYVSIIEEDLTVGYTAGQEFKKSNLDPRQFIGLTLEQVFGEHTPLVEENYLKTFGGAETQFELFINGQYQSYRTVPLIDSTGRIHRILSVVENITARKQAEKFLKESIAQNPMSIQVLDKEGFTLETNLAYKLLFGSIPPAGYSIFNDLQLAQKGMGEIFDRLRTGEVVHFPDVNFNPHDSIPELPDVPVWVRTIGFPISDSHEKPERFILMHENITARKQAEEVLHESEARYKLIFESAPLAINITRGTDIIYANPSYLKMFGFSNLDELKNFTPLELFTPESRAQILENIQRRAKGLPVPNSYEAECFRKDRTRFPILMHLTRTTFADGPATVGFIIDITERKLAEKALRENELKYRTLFETVNDANLLFTGDQWVDCNAGALRVFGCTREEIIGAHPRRFSPPMQPDGRSSEEESIKKINLAFAGEPQYFEWEHCHADGTPFPAEVSLNRMDLEGKPYIQAIVRDISERKQAELKLKEYSEHLEELVEERTQELREAQEKLIQQERLTVLGRLADSVSQELRNPLGIINNAIYYLRLVQPEADETIKEYLGIIEAEAHNADKIVSDLLDFSSNELVDREPIAVSELVSDALQHFPIPENVQVTLDLSENLPKVYLDPRQMVQVLGNLALNACQAMPKGGRLTVDGRQLTVPSTQLRTSHGQSSVVIAVKDTGVGIPPENLPKLFEPLFTTKPKGIGLGLAVSRKLVEANGGKIEVESEVGKGSTFTVWLPVKNVTASDSEAVSL